MRHVIIGTAGHIDHGKTALVRALTGLETDTLPEEKARGVTIDIGFAYWKENVTIIDVPGHERFVKNMVTGVCSVDFALFVIAADDGPMPQTREHLGILNLLGVEHGLIALTKTDLVDDDWLELVTEEIRNLVSGTFLENTEIVPVSSETGFGVDRLKELIEGAIAEQRSRPDSGVLRIPVDRAFSVRGFGTVVTGTVVSGSIKPDDALDLLPSGTSVRVRSLQTHGQGVEHAATGARVAVNLAGVDVGDVGRGDLLTQPGYFETTYMIDTRLSVLEDAVVPVKNRTRVHLHLGPRDVLARVIVLEGEEIQVGGTGLVQLRLEGPGVAARGDRFVIRRYSPMVTLGGGVVLDASPVKHRRFRRDVIEALKALETDDPSRLVLEHVRRAGRKPVGSKDLAPDLGVATEAVDRLLGDLGLSGAVMKVPGQAGKVVHAETWDGVCEEIVNAVGDHHTDQPLQAGLELRALRSLLSVETDASVLRGAVDALVREGRLALSGPIVSAADHRVQFTESQEAARSRILKTLDEAGATPPDLHDLFRAVDADDANQLVDAMRTQGDLVLLEDSLVFSTAVLEDICDRMKRHMESRGSMSVADFRDLAGTSRKFAVPLLNYFDAQGVTERQGDVRVLL